MKYSAIFLLCTIDCIVKICTRFCVSGFGHHNPKESQMLKRLSKDFAVSKFVSPHLHTVCSNGWMCWDNETVYLPSWHWSRPYQERDYCWIAKSLAHESLEEGRVSPTAGVRSGSLLSDPIWLANIHRVTFWWRFSEIVRFSITQYLLNSVSWGKIATDSRKMLNVHRRNTRS